MTDKDSMIWDHYQRLQESLSELMSPDFADYNRSMTYITLNQTFTYAERLFELVEGSASLSKPKQAIMAKLAHHIENCKEKGFQADFLNFIKKDVVPILSFIKSENQRQFDLAS
ncbi:MAG: hypothetical protein EOP07_10995 [Proteobacteria bacterium]|nr:MAG: hypothetical protein EOP07_10995 [Pseudomonadota bacterium]